MVGATPTVVMGSMSSLKPLLQTSLRQCDLYEDVSACKAAFYSGIVFNVGGKKVNGSNSSESTLPIPLFFLLSKKKYFPY